MEKEDALERLRSLEKDLNVGSSGPAPAHAHVSAYRSGGFSSRPHTFILGLNRKNFPSTGFQDPILLDEERDLTEKGEFLDLIKSITQSQLWNRMLKAKEKFYEIPFSVKTDLSSLKPIILNGVIDLVFLEPDGWVIADYKTDEINGGLQSFIDYYTAQVKVYRDFWEKITGEKVKEAGLYFTSINKWVKV